MSAQRIAKCLCRLCTCINDTKYYSSIILLPPLLLLLLLLSVRLQMKKIDCGGPGRAVCAAHQACIGNEQFHIFISGQPQIQINHRVTKHFVLWSFLCFAACFRNDVFGCRHHPNNMMRFAIGTNTQPTLVAHKNVNTVKLCFSVQLNTVHHAAALCAVCRVHSIT